MSAPALYLHLPGTARDALDFYQGVFGGETEAHTYGQFERTDGPAAAIAHGVLSGQVDLYVADAGEQDDPFRAQGLMVALLGHAEPTTLRTWFAALAEGGEVVEALQRRPWGASDGEVRDRFGVLWLIGYEHGSDTAGQAASSADRPQREL